MPRRGPLDDRSLNASSMLAKVQDCSLRFQLSEHDHPRTVVSELGQIVVAVDPFDVESSPVQQEIELIPGEVAEVDRLFEPSQGAVLPRKVVEAVEPENL